jgi:hypothetical protein
MPKSRPPEGGPRGDRGRGRGGSGSPGAKNLSHLLGELEVADDRAIWYLRIRDEDPLLFVAGPAELIERLDSSCSRFALKVSGDFLYAA